MGAVLPDVAELRSESIGELMLDGKVPLLSIRRLPFRIEYLDGLASEAGQCKGCRTGGRWCPKAASESAALHYRAGKCRRPVLGQQLVGATTLCVR